jgi:hypothetical protein
MQTGISVTGGRVGPPTAGVPGSLYDFVRRYLCDHGGSATRAEVREAIMSDPRYSEKLKRSRGFHSLISNMHHSGDIELDGPTLHATSRTYRRMRKQADPA